MVNDVAFYLLTAFVVVSALGVVLNRNILHAGLSLIICFWCVAGLYLLLDAPFLAAIQVLIYVGAISVLLLFAIMLTHRISSREPRVPSGRMLGAASIAVAFMLLAGWIFSNIPVLRVWLAQYPNTDIYHLALSFMSPGQFLVPFELVSILLLVALVAAVIIARRDEPLEVTR
jgi:NADH-quinone oxidoreductase subunit J